MVSFSKTFSARNSHRSLCGRRCRAFDRPFHANKGSETGHAVVNLIPVYLSDNPASQSGETHTGGGGRDAKDPSYRLPAMTGRPFGEEPPLFSGETSSDLFDEQFMRLAQYGGRDVSV